MQYLLMASVIVNLTLSVMLWLKSRERKEVAPGVQARRLKTKLSVEQKGND